MAETLKLQISVTTDIQKAIDGLNSLRDGSSKTEKSVQKLTELLTKQREETKKLKDSFDGELKSALNNAQKSFEKTNENAEQFKNALLGGLGVGAGITAFSLLERGIAGLRDTFKEAINEALESEKSQKLLAGALRAAGDASQQTLADFESYTKIVAQNTKVTDDQAAALVALAANLGAPKERIKEIVDAALDLSAAFGVDTSTAVEAVSRALQGQGRQLASIIPEYRKLTDEQLLNRDILGELGSRYGKFAEEEVKGADGSLNQLNKSYKELLETLGKNVTQNNSFKQTVDDTTGFIQFLDSLASGDRVIQYQLQLDATGNLTRTLPSLKTTVKEIDDIFNNVANGSAAKFSGVLENLGPIEAKLRDIQAQQAASQDTTKEQENLSAIQLLREEARTKEQEAKQNDLLFDQVVADESYNILATSLGDEEALNVVAEAKRLENANKHEDAIKLLKAKTAAAEVDIERKKASDLEKINTDLTNKQNALEKSKLDTAAAFGDAIIALTGDNAVAALALGKSIALAQVAITDAQARSAAVAAAATISILNPAAGASYLAEAQALITTQTALSVATIAAQTIAQVTRAKRAGTPGFAEGGIVPGNSFSGDNVPIRVNSGELILNKSQQDNLAGQLSGVSVIDNRDIVIQIDGREIARAVKSEIDKGFRLAS